MQEDAIGFQTQSVTRRTFLRVSSLINHFGKLEGLKLLLQASGPTPSTAGAAASTDSFRYAQNLCEPAYLSWKLLDAIIKTLQPATDFFPPNLKGECKQVRSSRSHSSRMLALQRACTLGLGPTSSCAARLLQAAMTVLQYANAVIGKAGHLADQRPSTRDADCLALSQLLRSLNTLLMARSRPRTLFRSKQERTRC